jgi:hypothetical protein
MVPRTASDKVFPTLASDSEPFVPIWHVTADRSAAKIAEGEWRQGKRHGPGVAVTADGTETAGQWTNDRAAGA